MIAATATDRPEIADFLRARIMQAMFPLSNLSKYGMDGGHHYAVRFWISRKAGKTTDVLTVTDGGMVMPLLPSGEFTKAADLLRDVTVTGMAGPQRDVRGLSVICLADRTPSFDKDEPQFGLDISDLVVPQGPGRIRPLQDAPADLIKGWIYDYDVNTLNASPDIARAQVDGTYATYIETGSHVVLMDGDTPLAMTGFNAQLPDIVQIGGVYTPPAMRGRGHARRAVGLHLAHAAARGVRQATLFSASAAAARVYRAIGFQQIGTWSLILLAPAPQVITS
ncbi:GNAT family N-acetyltransferase [Yoonia sp. SS1-5]|uniref:GNAT family N-acetyltransferase n=1 Tax=Yoonia rhodophyticola TaxID=3137370 RepID=A0AAN0MBR7_9RHOB